MSAQNQKSSYLPPCKVCGGKSSGFHYGVNSCEACKTFFRRTLLPTTKIKPCEHGGGCVDESEKGKISCSSCRHRKCLEVGMGREGCKKGRYSYRKRLENLREVEQLETPCQTPAPSAAPSATAASRAAPAPSHFITQDLLTLSDRVCAAFTDSFPDICAYRATESAQTERIRGYLRQIGQEQISTYVRLPGAKTDRAPDKDFSRINSVRSQLAGASSSLKDGRRGDDPKALAFKVMADMAASMEKRVKAFGGFVKRLPGFNDLDMEDRLILLKAVMFEQFALASAHQMRYDVNALVIFDASTEDIHLIPVSVLEEVFADADYHSANKRCVARVLKMALTVKEVSLLLAVLTCSADRVGIVNRQQVDAVQEKFIQALRCTTAMEHPEQPNRFAACLALLPEIRECGVTHARSAVLLLNELTATDHISPPVISILHLQPY